MIIIIARYPSMKLVGCVCVCVERDESVKCDVADGWEMVVVPSPPPAIPRRQKARTIITLQAGGPEADQGGGGWHAAVADEQGTGLAHHARKWISSGQDRLLAGERGKGNEAHEVRKVLLRSWVRVYSLSGQSST